MTVSEHMSKLDGLETVEQITDLFTRLKNLPKAVNREPTFMEIAGYPRFENVCSNILAFYLQPSNEHCFGTLFLDILATLIDKKIVIDRRFILASIRCVINTVRLEDAIFQ